MKIFPCCHGVRAATAVLLCGLFVCPASVRAFPKVTNVSPYPSGTNEFWLTATNMTVTNMGGTNVQVMVYIDDPPGGGGAPPGLPCPMVQVNVGNMIICHFQNKLNSNNIEGASIHWHGIEVDNDSDGTAVAQDSVMPGQGYVYRYVVSRPGLFWYHSHMIPGTTTFDGMYGPIVVTSNIESTLMASNILPSTNYTFPLVMSDISYSNGVPGKVYKGTNLSMNTLFQLCENYSLGSSRTSASACGPAAQAGNIVLVNGYVPSLAGSFGGPSTNSSPIYTVPNNQRVRLQLFNQSISRDFYLSLVYPSSNTNGPDTNLYRIGGQGGLLDNAILDGGVQGGYDFEYNQGSIVLGSGMRADVMFYPSGNNGDVVELVGNPLTNGAWVLSSGLPANYPIAFFVITNTGASNAPLADGLPILAGTSSTNASLETFQTNLLLNPPDSSSGTNSGTITFAENLAENAMTNVYTPAGSPTIDGYAATALDGNTGYGSWTNVPHPPSALWAHLGDVLQLAIVNNSGEVHPYHLHGFSMQPMYIAAAADLTTPLYTYDYNQFLDTLEVYPGQGIVFRIHLTDRPTYADTGIDGPVTVGANASSGGALGRWLMHCHIFLHVTIGMMSELNVVTNVPTPPIISPPTLVDAQMVGNGVFQFGFSNTNQGAAFTILSATNLAVPLIDWTAIGSPSNIAPGVLQFTDPRATNPTGFYIIRSP